MEHITIQELQRAIGRCIHAEQKEPYRLPADASKMANVFGQMIYYQVDSWPINDMKASDLEAFLRWKH